MSARGLLVSGARSGSGKTVVTLGLLAALKRRGVAVRAAKAGPDYIDPAFHAAATGHASVNLDTWAMPPALLDALVQESQRDADLLVIEGAMGLYDGVPGAPGRTGAAADLAVRYRLPVLLVLDVSGQSQTAAALVRGLAGHDAAVRIAGVVLNRVGSERHRALVTDAIAALGVPVVGALPRGENLSLPERHLGLVQAAEHPDLAAWLDRLAAMAEQQIDIDAAMANATPLPSPDVGGKERIALPPPSNRIALAADAAFTFAYPHVLDGWRRAGAEVVRFSPLADEPPPDSCDSCWLPGGYPELHAGVLAAAARFRAGLARFAATRSVHGECGGYMVLGQGLTDASGAHHAMAGLLGHATSFAQRRLHLGYRQARLLSGCPIGRARTYVRGHEFHYATLLSAGDDAPLAELTDGQGRPLGPTGGRRGHVTGTFFHAIAQAE
ncbi:MAG TPA: cobyrinate a,c-diamide synthase [Xanthobacteraceae bacterium]|jgi:cobyrinic acid a,c-diamide synthase|nr:cobyrinate a,c-diamide synthase [Xanthobacteraceae bacterium]